MAIAVLEIDVPELPAQTMSLRFGGIVAKPLESLRRLGAAVFSLATKNSRIRARVDSATLAASSLTMAITGANIAAGEFIGITAPQGVWKITAVASGAASGDGTFNTSGTDATCATNMAAAINSRAGLKDVVVASTNSGNLIITAVQKGSLPVIRVSDATVNGLSPAGGLLSGGTDESTRVTGTISITNNANLTSNTDTQTIGSVVLTWHATPSGENQVLIGANATASAVNLAAKINAHSKLAGLVTATSAVGVVTVQYDIPARDALLVTHAVSDATAQSVTQPSIGSTMATFQATRNWALGAV